MLFVEKEKENTFHFSFLSSLILKLFSTKDELIILIVKEKSRVFPCLRFRASFNFESLRKTSEIFNTFNSISHIKKCIINLILTENFEVSQEANGARLYLRLTETIVNLFIPFDENPPLNENYFPQTPQKQKEVQIKKEKIMRRIIHKINEEINLQFLKKKEETLKLNYCIYEHSDAVNSISITKDGRMASCSYDEKIKIINLHDYKCEVTLRGHSDIVFSVSQLSNGYLASCSWDKTIKIWEVNSSHYQCVKTLSEHDSAVFKVIELSNDEIASCSLDKTIKIWKCSSPFNLIKTLYGHTNAVTSILKLKNKNFIVSSGDFNPIIFWNTKTYKKEKVIKGVFCCYRNSMVEIEDNKLLVGGYNEIIIINTLTFQQETKIKYQKDIGGINSIISIQRGIVLCGTEKGMLVYLKISDCKTHVLLEGAHKKNITGLVKLFEGRFVSCSYDKSITIWEIYV